MLCSLPTTTLVNTSFRGTSEDYHLPVCYTHILYRRLTGTVYIIKNKQGLLSVQNIQFANEKVYGFASDWSQKDYCYLTQGRGRLAVNRKCDPQHG